MHKIHLRAIISTRTENIFKKGAWPSSFFFPSPTLDQRTLCPQHRPIYHSDVRNCKLWYTREALMHLQRTTLWVMTVAESHQPCLAIPGGAWFFRQHVQTDRANGGKTLILRGRVHLLDLTLPESLKPLLEREIFKRVVSNFAFPICKMEFYSAISGLCLSKCFKESLVCSQKCVC